MNNPKNNHHSMEISELGEFGLIHHLTSDIKLQNASSIKGVGDDCAIIAPTEGKRTLVTTDLLMEGVHFDLTYVPLYCLGYKAVMVNLSDIFAMGGTPKQITVSLGIGRRFKVEDITEIYRGMRQACDKHHVDIVGGDTTSSYTGLAISITAIGEASPEEIICRDGAHDTDLICVSGDLGAAYMGLQLLERERTVYNQQLSEARKSGNQEELDRLNDFQPDVSGREYLLERQLKPEARGDIIQRLRQAGSEGTFLVGRRHGGGNPHPRQAVESGIRWQRLGFVGLPSCRLDSLTMFARYGAKGCRRGGDIVEGIDASLSAEVEEGAYSYLCRVIMV